MRGDDPYSAMDKLLHRLAFWPPICSLLESVESSRFARELAEAEPDPPIWIAGLPRAGSTALLNLLEGSPELASPRYCDMPFVTVPLLWSELSGSQRHSGPLRERAHGDGVMIGPDSPEAFEEVLWLRHWAGHYRADRISLWRNDATVEGDFFETHDRWLRSLVAARRRQRAKAARPLLKNNSAIARLSFLAEKWPGARIIVPFREPGAQASSLLRQHHRASQHQRRSRFARRYADDLGHFEFGGGIRPIAFPGFDPAEAGDPDNLPYWLAYWAAAYRHILDALPDRAMLFDYDRACAQPEGVVPELASALGIDLPTDHAAAFEVRPRERVAVPDECAEIHRACVVRAATSGPALR